MINWQYYPRSDYPSEKLLKVIDVFEKNKNRIDSFSKKLVSNDVLNLICPNLNKMGFRVETGKKAKQKIRVPVLFGRNGKLQRYFDADAHHPKERVVLEVEAGRAVTNYQFLKDLFQACVMKDVDYFIIAVRNIYLKNKDFEKVTSFFEILYASGKLNLPLKGILVIGY